MLDFQATDAVGMRVQSVAKIDGLTKRRSLGIGKRFQEGKCRTISITYLTVPALQIQDDS